MGGQMENISTYCIRCMIYHLKPTLETRYCEYTSKTYPINLVRHLVSFTKGQVQ